MTSSGAREARGPSLHVFLTAAKHESRFEREARVLLDSSLATEVVLAGRLQDGLAEEEFLGTGIRIHRIRLRTDGLPRSAMLQIPRGIEWAMRISALAGRLRPSVIVAHSLPALAPAIIAGLAARRPVLYDAHELETERNGLTGARQVAARWMERLLIGQCAAVVCVSDAIADWYARVYGIARPTVVRNIPDTARQSPSDRPNPLRSRLGIPRDALVFLYQGGLFAGRRIEQFLRVFEKPEPGRHLVLMGYGELEPLVRAATSRGSNIHFLPAVPPQDVLAYTADADVGLVGVEAVCESYRLSLPNKLFEYLSAGLPCLAPDYPEMRRVVDEFRCGWVVDESDDAWRAAIDKVSHDWLRATKGAVAAAAGAFSWQEEGARFSALYRTIATRGCHS